VLSDLSRKSDLLLLVIVRRRRESEKSYPSSVYVILAVGYTHYNVVTTRAGIKHQSEQAGSSYTVH